jgi:hypothetical protein
MREVIVVLMGFFRDSLSVHENEVIKVRFTRFKMKFNWSSSISRRVNERSRVNVWESTSEKNKSILFCVLLQPESDNEVMFSGLISQQKKRKVGFEIDFISKLNRS